MTVANSILGIIAEARIDRYKQMIPKFLYEKPREPVFIGVGPDRREDKAQARSKRYMNYAAETIEEEIGWAIENLEREDIVVWFARYSILWNVFAISGMQLTEEDNTKKEEYLSKLLKTWSKKSGMERELSLSDFFTYPRKLYPEVKEDLVHYLALPIQEIEDYRFAWQTPDEVLKKFKGIEDEWKDSKKTFIPMGHVNKEAVILEDFGDGMVLMNLNINGCEEEAKAMSHCSTGSRRDDINWSIREKKKLKNIQGYEPHVTLIWNDDDGMITEIKGKGNSKPDPKYHRYIVAALMKEDVKGHAWPHGGYRQENDFRVTDLGQDEVNRLASIKPTIITSPEILKRFGFDPTNGTYEVVQTSVYEYSKENDDLPDLREKADSIVVAHYKEGVDFIREGNTGKDSRHYIKYVEEPMDNYYETSKSERDDLMEDAFKRAGEELILRIVDKLSEEIGEAVEENDDEIPRDAWGLAGFIANNEYDSEVASNISEAANRAVNDGYESGTQHAIYVALNDLLKDCGLVSKEGGKNLLFYPCNLEYSADSLAERLSRAGDGAGWAGYEEGYGDNKPDISVPHHGFSEYDEESAIDQFLSHHLAEIIE